MGVVLKVKLGVPKFGVMSVVIDNMRKSLFNRPYDTFGAKNVIAVIESNNNNNVYKIHKI